MKKGEILTKEFLEKKVAAGFTDKKIADEVGCSHSTVFYRRKNYKIKTRNKKLQEKTLSTATKGMLIGTLLGDGSIYHSRSDKCYLNLCHGESQKDYINYKIKVFSSIFLSQPYKFCKEGLCHYRVSSIAHPDLKVLREQFYKNGRKRVTREILEELTIAGLAMWFMDDGWCEKRKRYITYCLATCSFDLEEHKLIREMFRRKFNVMTTILRKKSKKHPHKKLYYLYICMKSTQQFRRLIENFVKEVPCMVYKLGQLYNPQRLYVGYEKKKNS